MKLVFNFSTEAEESVMVKIAISSVSMKNALENLETEIPHWDFEKVKADASASWEKQLQKIVIKGTPEREAKFYAALYHNNIHPTINHDVNGEYREIEQEVHQTKEYTLHTMFPLWDTFRATHPLFTLIHQIDKEFYKAAPDGYIGNEDGGQMSAWYVFSAMGFYPINPAGGIYIFGSPLLEEVEMNLENRNKFKITAHNLSEENIYIQSVKLNGKAIKMFGLNMKILSKVEN